MFEQERDSVASAAGPGGEADTRLSDDALAARMQGLELYGEGGAEPDPNDSVEGPAALGQSHEFARLGGAPAGAAPGLAGELRAAVGTQAPAASWAGRARPTAAPQIEPADGGSGAGSVADGAPEPAAGAAPAVDELQTHAAAGAAPVAGAVQTRPAVGGMQTQLDPRSPIPTAGLETQPPAGDRRSPPASGASQIELAAGELQTQPAAGAAPVEPATRPIAVALATPRAVEASPLDPRPVSAPAPVEPAPAVDAVDPAPQAPSPTPPAPADAAAEVPALAFEAPQLEVPAAPSPVAPRPAQVDIATVFEQAQLAGNPVVESILRSLAPAADAALAPVAQQARAELGAGLAELNDADAPIRAGVESSARQTPPPMERVEPPAPRAPGRLLQQAEGARAAQQALARTGAAQITGAADAEAAAVEAAVEPIDAPALFDLGGAVGEARGLLDEARAEGRVETESRMHTQAEVFGAGRSAIEAVGNQGASGEDALGQTRLDAATALTQVGLGTRQTTRGVTQAAVEGAATRTHAEGEQARSMTERLVADVADLGDRALEAGAETSFAQRDGLAKTATAHLGGLVEQARGAAAASVEAARIPVVDEEGNDGGALADAAPAPRPREESTVERTATPSLRRVDPGPRPAPAPGPNLEAPAPARPTPPSPKAAPRPAPAAETLQVADAQPGTTPAAASQAAPVEPLEAPVLEHHPAEPAPEEGDCPACTDEAPLPETPPPGAVPGRAPVPAGRLQPLAPLDAAPPAGPAPSPRFAGLPGFDPALQGFAGGLHADVATGVEQGDQAVREAVEAGDEALRDQTRARHDGAFEEIEARHEALHAQRAGDADALGEEASAAACAVGCDAHARRQAIQGEGDAQVARLEKGLAAAAEEANAGGEAARRHVAEHEQAGLDAARGAERDARGEVIAEAKTCSEASQKKLEALKQRIEQARVDEHANLDKAHAESLADLETKLAEERARLHEAAQTQRDALRAEIEKRDGEIQAQIEDKRRLFDEQIQSEADFLTRHSIQEVEKVQKEGAKQAQRVEVTADAEAKTVVTTGDTQAKKVRDETTRRAKEARDQGEPKAKEAIAAAEARAGQLSDPGEQATVRAQGTSRAATARALAAKRGRWIERQGERKAKAIEQKAKKAAAKLKADAQVKKAQVLSASATAVLALGKQLGEAIAKVDQKAAEGVARMEQERARMLDELRAYEAEQGKAIEATVSEGEAKIDEEQQRAREKIDEARLKAQEQIDEKTDSALEKLEAGCDENLKQLERMVERTEKRLESSRKQAERRMQRQATAAQRRAAAHVDRSVRALKVQGRKAVRGVKKFVDEAKKNIDALQQPTLDSMYQASADELGEIIKGATAAEAAMTVLGGACVNALQTDATVARSALEKDGAEARKYLKKKAKKLDDDIDERWADDARREAEKLLDDNGAMNVVTDEEAERALLIMSSLPGDARAKAFEEMDDERFQSLLDELPKERKMELYENMTGTDVGAHIARNFAHWAGEDGYLTQAEMAKLMADPSISAEDAAALAALRGKIKEGQKKNDDEWGAEDDGLTLDDYAHVAKEGLDGKYRQGMRNIKEKSGQALFTDASGKADWKTIKQQQIGDCYYLAALIHEVKQDPMYPNKAITPNKDGTYTVDIPGRGAVTVSELTDAEKAVTGRSDGYWLAIMEKAYAKSRVGEDEDGSGWEAITGDHVEVGIEDATGNEGQRDDLADVDERTTGAKIDQAVNKDDKAVTVSTAGSNKHKLPTPHAYTVIGYDPATKTVKLRNPWGHGTGDLKNEGGGVFEMPLDEFHETFKYAGYEQ